MGDGMAEVNDPHALDSTAHPVGEHALWADCCRLRALLRTGLELADQLSPLWLAAHPGEEARLRAWRAAVRREVGA